MTLLDRMSVAFTTGIDDSFETVSRAAATRLPALLAGAIVVLASWLLGRLAFTLTRRALARRSTQGHVDLLLARLVRGTVVAVGLVIAAAVGGFDVGGLVASLGLAGLTLGFALRDVLANSVSGVMLLVQRPFRIGDTITVAGHEGVVTDVRVRDTALRLADGRIAYVPNITVFNGVVVNVSQEPVRRLEISVWTPAGADVLRARDAVAAAVASTDGVLPEPAVEVRVGSLSTDRARLTATAWVDTRVRGMGETQSDALARAGSAISSPDAEPVAVADAGAPSADEPAVAAAE